MKTKNTTILLDPDQSAWGSDCDEATAQRANATLLNLLAADGYNVDMNTLAETRIMCDTDDQADEDAQREAARAAIERFFLVALDEAIEAPAPLRVQDLAAANPNTNVKQVSPKGRWS